MIASSRTPCDAARVNPSARRTVRRFAALPALALAATTLLAGATLRAAPTACPTETDGRFCSVTDADAELVFFNGVVDGQPFANVEDLTVAGVRHLFEERIFYRAAFGAAADIGSLDAGVNPPRPVETLPLLLAEQDDAANTIEVRFGDDTLRVELLFTLTGGAGTAGVEARLTLTNPSDTQAAVVDLFVYTDWDLLGLRPGDTATFVSDTRLEQSKDGNVGTTVSATAFDFFDLGECCADRLLQKDLNANGDLNDQAGPFTSNDVAAAVQYDALALAPGASLTISRQLRVRAAGAPIFVDDFEND